MGKPVALRTSLIWHDEVMGDVVCDQRAPITVGPAHGATFVTPDLGLPDDFAIVRPGRRGHVLALGGQMRGTISVGGVEHDVAAFVAGGEGGFRATAIGPGDWGVIELEGSGQHKLFFQFVPLDDAQPLAPTPVLAAGALGYAISAAVLALLWLGAGVGLGEAVLRGACVSGLALAMAAALRWLLQQDSDSRASLAFSVVVHAAILFTTYELYTPGAEHDLARADAPSSYHVARLDKPRPAIAAPVARDVPPAAKLVPATRAIDPGTRHRVKPTPTVEQWKRMHPDTHSAPPQRATPGLSREQEQLIHDISHPAAGFREGIDALGNSGGGDGDETHPGQFPKGTRDTDGPKGDPKKKPGDGDPGIDPGKLREAKMCAGADCGGDGERTIVEPTKGPSDNGPTLSASDIERVMSAYRGLLKSCYQRRLNLVPGLAGGFTVEFRIDPSGRVSSARLASDSLHDAEVASCVTRNVRKLSFKASGGGANVRYPLVFSH